MKKIIDFFRKIKYTILVAGSAEKVLFALFSRGGIAQLARAIGSYPVGRWFKSCCRYQLARWSRG